MRNRLILVSFFAVAGLVFNSQHLHAEKVLKYSEDGAPNNFDPIQLGDTYSNTIATAVYDTLYEYKYLARPYILKTNLAESMPTISKDGLTYTIKLKKGVFFTDDACFPKGKGREVVAADVVYSMKRHFDKKNPSQGAWLWADRLLGMKEWKEAGSDFAKPAKGVYATGKYTVVFKLTKPFPQLPNTLAMGFAAVISHEAVKKYGKSVAMHPVGSGPYKFISHNTQRTILKKNPKYRKDTFKLAEQGYDKKIHSGYNLETLEGKTLPIIDTIEMNWMQQAVARWNSFTKGNETVYAHLQNEQVDQVLDSKTPVTLKKDYAKKYNVRVAKELGLVFNKFNMDHPQLGHGKTPAQAKKNKALRCAIRKAVNWKGRVDRFYLGLGKPYPGYIHPDLDGYDKNLSMESVTQDIKGAKKLLKDNGWTAKNLPKLIYPITSSRRNKAIYEMFRGNLQKIGYPRSKIKEKTLSTFGEFSKFLSANRHDFAPLGWGYDYPDAENTLALFYGPNRVPGSNHGNYNNPEYDKIFVKASQMNPSPERTKLYMQLNKIIIDDCAFMGSFSRTRVHMWHNNVILWPERNVIGNIFKYADLK